MTVKEHRMRKIMFAESSNVLVRIDGADWTAGTVHAVGWAAGTYRVKVGRRLHYVSMTQVRGPNGEVFPL